MALKAVGLLSRRNSQQAQHPWLSQVPRSVYLEIPDPGTVTAAARVEGLPFQLPWAQVLPQSTCQPPFPWAVLGQAVPESQLPCWRRQLPGGGLRVQLGAEGGNQILGLTAGKAWP